MKFSVLLTVATYLLSAQGLEIFKRPRLDDAAKIARTLISRESLVNINTIYQAGDDAGLPASFVEYYTDCGDGDPIILAVDIGTSFRNINGGSPVSLTVRVGDHGPNEEVNREYPGSRPNSVAGSPRINLRGEFVTIDSDAENYDAIEKCFVNRHKDAAWWLPGNPIHKTHFVKFVVKDAYFLGGFGDTGYIGKIPSELYHNSTILDDLTEEGVSVEIQRKGDDNFRDLAFDAFIIKHNVKDLTKNFYTKVTSQIELFKKFSEGEANAEADSIIDLSTEESETVLNIIKSKFSKRDGDSDVQQWNLKDLSKEQISKIIEELEILKTQIFQYGEQILNKLPQQHEPSPKHGKGPEGRERPKHHERPDHKRPEGPGFDGPKEHHRGPKGDHAPPKDHDRHEGPGFGKPREHHRGPEGDREPPRDHHRPEGDREPPREHHRGPKGDHEPPRDHHRPEGEHEPPRDHHGSKDHGRPDHHESKDHKEPEGKHREHEPPKEHGRPDHHEPKDHRRPEHPGKKHHDRAPGNEHDDESKDHGKKGFLRHQNDAKLAQGVYKSGDILDKVDLPISFADKYVVVLNPEN